MIHEKADNIVTALLSMIGFATGTAGLYLADIDLLLAIFLKFISIIATLIVIFINWDKTKEIFNSKFKKPKIEELKGRHKWKIKR